MPCGKVVAEESERQPDSIEILKRNARKSELPEDWEKVIEMANARHDTADLGLAYVSYFQSLNNMNRDEGFMTDVYPALTFRYEAVRLLFCFVQYACKSVVFASFLSKSAG